MANEATYAGELAQARAQEEPKTKIPKPKSPPFPVAALIFALINDIIDYVFFIGSIPLIADTLDVVIGLIIWFLLTIKGYKIEIGMKNAAANIVELIPGGDLVPSYTILVLYIYFKEKSLSKITGKAALKAAV